ncbi:hypothetical protein SUGI_0349190 [Cryptomeria japonica]|nr:hypothetical protein SUGI_0349190 [Cryptomeria japonica]
MPTCPIEYKSTKLIDSINLASSTLVAGVLLIILLTLLKKTNKKSLALPLSPSPPGWPFIGNLPQLGDKTHQSLPLLAHKYGPLMTIRLGMQTTFVMSSPSIAREVLNKNDHNFSSRTINTAARTQV